MGETFTPRGAGKVTCHCYKQNARALLRRPINLEQTKTGHEIVVARIPSKIQFLEERERFILTLAFGDDFFFYPQKKPLT